MNLRGELLVALSTLVVLNLIFAFGAIGLFVRMGPAIEHILEENVTSIVAAEEILVELSRADETLTEQRKARILESLDQVESNVTEDEERPILDSLRTLWPSVVAGDGSQRELFVEQVRELILVNREAMRIVDERAQSLGRSGAWAAVFMGFVSFLLSLLISTRMQRRFVQPLIDIHRVLRDAREGEALRRCSNVLDAPREVLDVAQAINELLDERLTRGAQSDEVS